MQDDDLIAAYESGLSVATLAKETGKHPNHVLKRLRDSGVRLRSRPEADTLRKAQTVDLLKAIRMRDAGFTYKEIAAAMGITDNTVAKRFRDCGIAPVPRGIKPVDVSPILARRAQGSTFKEIAADMDCSTETIRRWLRAAGVVAYIPKGKAGPVKQ